MQEPDSKFSILCPNFCLATGQMPSVALLFLLFSSSTSSSNAETSQQVHDHFQDDLPVAESRSAGCLNSLERGFSWNSLCQASLLLFAFACGLFGI